MNAPVNLNAETARSCGKAGLEGQYYAFSGKFIEKCAQAESHVFALLRTYHPAAAKQARQPLACKLRLLRDAVAKEPAGESQAALLELLNELEPFNELRTELAHSTISRGWLDDEDVLVMKNAAESHPAINRRVIFRIDVMKKAHKAFSQLVERLAKLEQELTGPS